MELTILGANGTYPTPDGACSGYLIEHDGFRLWMDMGSGTMSSLQRYASLGDIDAIFLSHAHPDHCVDIFPFFYWLLFDESQQIPVYAPRGTLQKLEVLVGHETRDRFHRVLRWIDLEPGDMVDLGPLHLTAFDSAHSSHNITARVEAGGRVFCYSGDTGPNPHLVKAARDADLFLCEASWLDADHGLMDPIHMKASEAGAAAREAGVSRLMLTHLWPRNDLRAVREQAGSAFGGDIELAVETERTEV